MCWNDRLFSTEDETTKAMTSQIKSIPTMTIGDIMDILPEEIEEKVLNIFAFGETWSVGWEGIQYCGSNTLIDPLFETLKSCIKQKHIAL